MIAIIFTTQLLYIRKQYQSTSAMLGYARLCLSLAVLYRNVFLIYINITVLAVVSRYQRAIICSIFAIHRYISLIQHLEKQLRQFINCAHTWHRT